MLRVQSAVAGYTFPKLAEEAVRVLQELDTDVSKVSIAALHEPSPTDKMPDEEARYRGQQGRAWGGPWALLHDSALFNVEGLGLVRLAGPIMFWMEAVLNRAVAYQGVTALGAGLVCIGVPIETVMKYEQALRAHQLLLIVHGETMNVVAAKNVMASTRPASLMVHGDKTVSFNPSPQV